MMREPVSFCAPARIGGAPTPAGDQHVSGLLAGTSVESRPYQLRILSKALRMFRGTFRDRAGDLEPAAHSVMIESPTGSGKTVMGLALARQMQREFGFSVGWVAMRRNLLAQAEEENRRWGFDVDLVTISMFDKAPPPVDFLVVDEAQHDAAMSMANLHCNIRPRKVLGLTATPFRTDRIRLCFDKVIRDAGIHQLIQDGYLPGDWNSPPAAPPPGKKPGKSPKPRKPGEDPDAPLVAK